jgi:hypothetical protein
MIKVSVTGLKIVSSYLIIKLVVVKSSSFLGHLLYGQTPPVVSQPGTVFGAA